MIASKHHLTRFMAVFAGGTMLSRVLGLVRDIVVAGWIPFGAREIFLFAFRFPNMLRDMLGEGAVNAAYVPLFSRSLETDGEAAFRRLVRACLGATLILFALLAAAGVLLVSLLPGALALLQPFTGAGMPPEAQLALTQDVMRWLMPYLFFIGTAVFAMGPLFVMRHYGTPSWSPVILNVAIIASCLVASGRFADPVWALVTGVWLGGIGQLAVMFYAMKRHAGVLWPSFELNHPGIRKAALLLVPVILGQATGEVNKMVDAFFALKLEAVSILYFANRLVQLPLSIFGMAVAVAILPSISAAGARGDGAEIRATLMHGFRQSAFLVLPALIGLLVLGEPIMRLLFAHRGGEFSPEEAQQAATALFYYAWGLLAFAWVKVSVQGFFAVHDTKTPVIIASLSMGLNIALNLALAGPLGYRGLALATSVSFAANFLGLYVMLGRRFGALVSAEFLVGIAKIVLASAFMGAAVYAVWKGAEALVPGDSAWAEGVHVLVPVAAGVGVYGLVSAGLRSEEMKLLATLLRYRAGGRGKH